MSRNVSSSPAERNKPRQTPWLYQVRFTHTKPCPCRSPAMPCRWGFRICLSHLIYTVRPCLIHTCHAAPMLCSAVLSKATAQHGSRETACGPPARVRLLPATTRSCTKFVIRNISISDAGGQCETKQHLSWTRKRVVEAHYKKYDLF
jgi:hypothetical protein